MIDAAKYRNKNSRDENTIIVSKIGIVVTNTKRKAPPAKGDGTAQTPSSWKPPLCKGGAQRKPHLLVKPPVCKGRWHGVSCAGGIVSHTADLESCEMIALQSLTRFAGAPFTQGGLMRYGASRELPLLGGAFKL